MGDVMDNMGLRRQFLPPQIQPLHPDMVVIGRAMTVLEADLMPEAARGDVNPRSVEAVWPNVRGTGRPETQRSLSLQRGVAALCALGRTDEHACPIAGSGRGGGRRLFA